MYEGMVPYIYIASQAEGGIFMGEPAEKVEIVNGCGRKVRKKILNKYSSPCQEEVPGRPQLSCPLRRKLFNLFSTKKKNGMGI